MLESKNIDLIKLDDVKMKMVNGGNKGNNVIAPDDEDQNDDPIFPIIWY
ncbi:hypothetical protein [Aquimarina pacifica]|nr:hypothetical protein [Aquimarina pacifica]